VLTDAFEDRLTNRHRGKHTVTCMCIHICVQKQDAGFSVI
jgi:hypothetical protein